MAHDRAVLLRKAGEVQRGAAAAVKMGGHAQQRADRDDAGAADACDQDIEGCIQLVFLGQRKVGEQLAGIDRGGFRLLERAAMNSHKAWTKSLGAGIVLVAVRLVDLPLAPEFGFERLDRNAVRG
jgi:hypothetical protein